MYLSPNNLDDVKKMHAERRRADRRRIKIGSAVFYLLLTAALALGLGIVGSLAVTVVEIQHARGE